MSTQTTVFQREFKERTRLPFELLSDSDLALVRAMNLPTFQFPVESGGPTTLVSRMSWVVRRGRIEQLIYPVFPPQENAARVIAGLRVGGGRAER